MIIILFLEEGKKNKLLDQVKAINDINTSAFAIESHSNHEIAQENEKQ